MYRIVLLLVAASAAFAESGVGSSGGGGGGEGGGAPPPPGAPGTPPGEGGPPWIFIAFFVLMGFMLWSTFRSQKKEKQKQAALISGLKLGDQVETIGGLRGEIVRRGEQELDIRSGESTFTIALGAVKQMVVDDPTDQKKQE